MDNIITPFLDETYNDYINRIINERKRERDYTEYQEEHHILPQCCGGKDCKENLVFLYAQEHYYAHKLLALENSSVKGLQDAWWNMCQCTQNGNRKYFITADEYAEARKRFSINMQGNQYAKGYKFTPEQREKQSLTHKGKNTGENNPMYGKQCSEHCKALLSEQLSGGKNPAAKKVKCVETNEIFECMNDAALWCGLGGKRPGSTIGACANGKQKSAGKHPITGEKLHWVYVE